MRSDPVLTSMYVPLIAMSATALFLIGRGLWRRIVAGTLNLKEHQILIAVTMLFASDVIESMYWGVGRLLSQQTFWNMAFVTPVVITQKMFILAAAIVSIDAWCRFREIKYCRVCLLGVTALLWIGSYIILRLV